MIDAPAYLPRAEYDAQQVAIQRLQNDAALIVRAAECVIRGVPLIPKDREAVQQAAARIHAGVKELL